MVGISVIGDQNFTIGFKLAGIRDTYIEKNIEERLMSLLQEKKTSIIVIHDTDYKNLSPNVKRRVNESMEPVVISVGKLDEENIREKIKKAIGIDLYKSNQEKK
jgi:V/A-type H+/Na+-transporting ATPase subunit F